MSSRRFPVWWNWRINSGSDCWFSDRIVSKKIFSKEDTKHH
nr:MAG TPA: hypothetical protein [Caudoviricetes sp.]DAX26814.1 MAG TPA: hypothetical protein [Caudoviricetes sp.]